MVGTECLNPLARPPVSPQSLAKSQGEGRGRGHLPAGNCQRARGAGVGRGFHRPQGALSTLPFWGRPLINGLMGVAPVLKMPLRTANGVAS